MQSLNRFRNFFLRVPGTGAPSYSSRSQFTSITTASIGTPAAGPAKIYPSRTSQISHFSSTTYRQNIQYTRAPRTLPSFSLEGKTCVGQYISFHLWEGFCTYLCWKLRSFCEFLVTGWVNCVIPGLWAKGIKVYRVLKPDPTVQSSSWPRKRVSYCFRSIWRKRVRSTLFTPLDKISLIWEKSMHRSLPSSRNVLHWAHNRPSWEISTWT